jgi:4-amino-4-deoxychorismate lyase
MYRLVESIRLQDGTFHNLPYHQQRMDESVCRLTGSPNCIRLANMLTPIQEKGLYKFRLVYTTGGDWQHTITAYQPVRVTSLQVVYDDEINYPFKFEDRSNLQKLFARRGHADDVLIVKNGLVTDASYSNVVFFDGQHWITPSTPLLPGVMRTMLLDAGEIRADEIPFRTITTFQKVKLINALLGFQGPEFPVSHILF